MNQKKDVEVVKTSSADWLQTAASHYKNKIDFILNDDAMLGVNPNEDTILKMGLKGKLSQREWSGVMVSIGVAGVGAWLLVMAALDPEPFSKIGVTIAAGAVLLSSGGFYAVRILTNIKPPRIKMGGKGIFEIDWDS